MHALRRAGILGLTLGIISGLLYAATASGATQPYAWHKVEIVGGGFIPGITFNTKQRDLIYARTDWRVQ